jgi:hypothetical protein
VTTLKYSCAHRVVTVVIPARTALSPSLSFPHPPLHGDDGDTGIKPALGRRTWPRRRDLLRKPLPGLVLNATFEQPGDVVFEHACALGCEGIVSKRLGSRYRSGRTRDWLKFKNPAAPAVRREAEEEWGKERWR